MIKCYKDIYFIYSKQIFVFFSVNIRPKAIGLTFVKAKILFF